MRGGAHHHHRERAVYGTAHERCCCNQRRRTCTITTGFGVFYSLLPPLLAVWRVKPVSPRRAGSEAAAQAAVVIFASSHPHTQLYERRFLAVLNSWQNSRRTVRQDRPGKTKQSCARGHCQGHIVHSTQTDSNNVLIDKVVHWVGSQLCLAVVNPILFADIVDLLLSSC